MTVLYYAMPCLHQKCFSYMSINNTGYKSFAESIVCMGISTLILNVANALGMYLLLHLFI